MACIVEFEAKGGQRFKLGKFNEGKKTDTEIGLTAAKKFHNLIRKLQCGGCYVIVIRGSGATRIPAEHFLGKI